MGTRFEEAKKAEARKRAVQAAAVSAASVALVVLHAPVVGAVGLAGGAVLGVRWLRYRVQNSVKF